MRILREPLEKDIQNAVKKYAVSLGWEWRKRSRSDPFGSNAEPDGEFFMAVRQIWFCEFKAPGKKSTPLQKDRQDVLRKCGFCVYECDDEDYGKRIVDWHTKNGTVKPYRGK